MALSVGTKVGPYEIVGALGAGGMGEVYRARDTRLNREVALKVLPELFALDSNRLARFKREAQVLASLNHPNIAAIYGVEESDGLQALILELVDGPTLADVIAARSGRAPAAAATSESASRGAAPSGGGAPRGLELDEALPIARQIAEALEAAHEQGIIHRDLKPANVKLRPDGTVKVLDFGLAKMLDSASRPAEAGRYAGIDLNSPTVTSPAMTRMGVILGTAAYMSPEQARGRAADKRSDVWAFGCVLFEMLTGRRAFDGEEVTDTLASVLKGEPDWNALPAESPPSIRTLLKACLAKDRRERIADVSTALFIIRHQASLAPASDLAIPATMPAQRLPFWRRAIPAAAVIVVGIFAGYGAWNLKPAAARVVTRFTITLSEGDQFSQSNSHWLALSPDGTRLVYAANNHLYLRALDQLDAAPIRGVEGIGSTSPRSPFFSQDSQWIGFWQDGQLKKVSVSGGAPVTLSAVAIPFGASWGPDNAILVGEGPMGIWRVSGNGGTPENIIKVSAGQRAQSPQVLPGGRTVLFTLAQTASWDEAQIVVQSLDTGVRHTLITGGTDGRYLPTGHLVYVLRGTLLAVPFNAKLLKVTGGPVPLVEGVRQPAGAGAAVSGAAHFAVSADGALAYVPPTGSAVARRTLVWVDRQQREETIAAPPRPYVYARLSPDGTRIALDIQDDNRDIWVWDLTRGTLTRLTFDPSLDRAPVWTPDGQRIIFSSDRAGVANLFWQAANGIGNAERLTESSKQHFAQAVSPDGTRLVLGEDNSNLMMLGLDDGRRALGSSTPSQRFGEAKPLVQTSFMKYNADISADGRWLAYQSNSSGAFEVYVRPFPDVAGGQWQVSTAGGMEPLWARDGRELFYRGPDGSVMRVPITPSSTWIAGTPTEIVEARSYSDFVRLQGAIGTAVLRTYDVSPDGRRFLMIKNSDADRPTTAARIIVVQNWTEELKRRVPAK